MPQTIKVEHQENTRPIGPDTEPTALSDDELRNVLFFLEGVREAVAKLFARGYTLENGDLIPPKDSTDSTHHSN